MKPRVIKPGNGLTPARSQNRRNKLRLGPLSPEQTIAGILKVSLEDVQRIREQEKKTRSKSK